MANSFVACVVEQTGWEYPQRLRIWGATLAFSTLALAGCGPPCTPTSSAYLFVPLHPQENAVWCWAATGQMVMEALGHPVEQCEIANRGLGRDDCICNRCDTPETPPNCVSTGWPPFREFDFHFHRTHASAISWSKLKSQLSDGPICKRTPVVFSWRWPGGGAHAMVAIGYSTDPEGERLVHILDPLLPCEGFETIISYDEYRAVVGHHSHGRDYYDIRYEGDEG